MGDFVKIMMNAHWLHTTVYTYVQMKIHQYFLHVPANQGLHIMPMKTHVYHWSWDVP